MDRCRNTRLDDAVLAALLNALDCEGFVLRIGSIRCNIQAFVCRADQLAVHNNGIIRIVVQRLLRLVIIKNLRHAVYHFIGLAFCSILQCNEVFRDSHPVQIFHYSFCIFACFRHKQVHSVRRIKRFWCLAIWCRERIDRNQLRIWIRFIYFCQVSLIDGLVRISRTSASYSINQILLEFLEVLVHRQWEIRINQPLTVQLIQEAKSFLVAWQQPIRRGEQIDVGNFIPFPE
ncbi:hypothetical protein D3C78_1209930 [compost metagenome]